MESYPYPICVELRNLEEKHKERIVSYFRIKRKSGGGECSELKLLQGNVYTISFKEEQAQQRVLDAKDHIINVANETIKVTVWKSEEVKPPQEMFANEDNFGKFKGSDTCSPSVSSTNREHTMVQKVDPYLRQYLQDCKDVAYELSQQLSQIQCSPQFLAESDNTILIKMSSGENSCSENVESIFKSMAKKYECHVEVDPRKRQILMKMPHLIKKPLQVYNEPTQRTTVIVGPIADIYELLTVVEGVASQDRQGESMKIQLRMSKPKYTLLLDSFERAMEGQIKISFDGKSAMYLEGTPDAVKKGACKFQEQSKKILEETIDVKSFLKTFLRLKSTQDTLATLLSSQGIAVTMDIDLDVTFFGLSMEMLENAKKILLTKLLQEEENLPESFKTTSKLEKLKKFVQETEDQINKVTTKVKIQEVAQWQRICVAGFTENVRYVIKTLKDYFDNNALTTLEVPLQFPQVASCFHDLLNYKDLQFSGVELQIVETIPLKVNITGPQQLASNVQRSIEKALRSVIVEVLVISKPGAYKYFSECGRTYISLFSKNCKCVIELKESTSIKELNSSETQRDLCGFELETGLVLSLRQGDITKQKVDVIVNAANELLSHGKGVASAISKAGGSEFQRECSELVKRQGQIKTGTAVLTNAWKLPCKAVIHAVGPNWNEEKDVNRVKQLLGSAIKDALEIAEKGGFQTMAIPCVSCGRYNVPIEIGAECVISTVRNFAIIPRKVRSITIVDINRDTLGKFQGACHKLLGKGGAASNQNFKDEKASDVQMSTDDVTNSNLQVEVVLGSLENQKADALVVPLPHTLDINTTKVSKNLIERAGKQLINRFDDSTKNKKISPGDVVPVQEVPNLECIQVLYLVCLKWDGAQGKALEILKKTFQDCLEHCHLNALQSAAIPVIGPGKILGFPHDVAIKALLEEISRFEKVCPSWLKKVRIVIHPDDKVSSKVIQERKCHFDFKDFKMNMETEETSFFHSLTSLVDEVTIMMDRVKLQLVFGDIAQESSDIIVNSTSFNNPPLGVSKVLLTAAGSEVEQEFENACKRQKNNMVITKAGSLNCKNIVHICWENNLSVIEKRTKEVIELCETLSFRSVSFPAVCTGAGGLKPNAVAKAMLDGISAAVTNQNVNTVSVVRIVLFKKDIFESFKSTVESCYGNTKRNEAAKKMKLKEKKKLKIENYCKPSIDILSLIPDEDVPPALFNVIGWHSKNVKEAKDNLESVFNTVYHEESLQDDNIFSLSVQDIQTLLETAKNKSVHVSVDQHDKSRLLLKGLRDDVIYIVQQVQLLVNSLLKRELEKRNQELVRCDVQWYYHEKNQSTPFTLETNFILEEAFSNNSIQVTVTDESMRMFNINLRKMVATTPDSSEEIELKRIENSLVSSFPPSWTPMRDNLILKTSLDSSSAEFQKVEDLFKKTALDKIVVKIERIQNSFQWQAYQLKKQHLIEKNGDSLVNEMNLFHGTTKESCSAIERNGFNRNFAGKNGVSYGYGVYFAKNAVYSTKYAIPDKQNLCYMYMARVLVGTYTIGKKGMKVPPPRFGSNKNDLFDSLVDSDSDPTIFVVFHDDQVYPEYLVTYY